MSSMFVYFPRRRKGAGTQRFSRQMAAAISESLCGKQRRKGKWEPLWRFVSSGLRGGRFTSVPAPPGCYGYAPLPASLFCQI